MNLGRLLTQAAAIYPERTALVWGDRSWTWAALNARVDALVAGLRALGVAPGDRVMVQARNGNQMVEIPFACFKAGAVWVPVNYRLTPDEVAGLAETAGVKAMFYQAPFAPHADAAAHASTSLDCMVAMDAPRDGETGYEELIDAHAWATPFHAEVDREDPLWFFFTSGTTGRPKAAVLTHGQMCFVVTNHVADLMPGLSHRDVSLVVAPLSHGAGVHLLAEVARGAVSILPAGDTLDPDEVWRLVEDYGVSNMFTVPTIVKRLVEHPAVDAHDHSSLRHVIYAGAPMYRADQVRALRKLGLVLVQYYGLGEVTGCITVLPAHMHSLDDEGMPVGSCGFARTGMEVAIKDQEGNILGPDEQGEICARGPAVFAGYYDNPEANAQTLKDGWFHTGDLGRMDAQGFVYITGRASDMYISGGSNIYPREAEEVLLSHPAVSEVAVLGVPDPTWGESGVAVVVPVKGALIDAGMLVAHLEGRLAKYKWPRRFFFWDSLPKSGYGKVPKYIIRDRLFEEGALEKDAPV